jgi:hypothetical protein
MHILYTGRRPIPAPYWRENMTHKTHKTLDELFAEESETLLAKARDEIAREAAEWVALPPEKKLAIIAEREAKMEALCGPTPDPCPECGETEYHQTDCPQYAEEQDDNEDEDEDEDEDDE